MAHKSIITRIIQDPIPLNKKPEYDIDCSSITLNSCCYGTMHNKCGGRRFRIPMVSSMSKSWDNGDDSPPEVVKALDAVFAKVIKECNSLNINDINLADILFNKIVYARNKEIPFTSVLMNANRRKTAVDRFLEAHEIHDVCYSESIPTDELLLIPDPEYFGCVPFQGTKFGAMVCLANVLALKV